MRSIRSRVLVGSMLAALAIQVVLAVVSHGTTKQLLVYHFDDELRTHAGTLAALIHRVGDHLMLEFADDLLPFYRSSPTAEYFEVRDVDGRVIGRSESLAGHHLPEQWGTPDEPSFFNLQLPDGRPGRAIGVRNVVGANSVGVVVAEPRRPLDEALDRLLESSALTAVGFGLALGVLLWIVLRRGFRPLTELSERVTRIDARQPRAGLGMNEVPTELAPVVKCLDDLLVRMRDSLDRERRITTNIAHELQTPVAELRTLTDVAMRWPEDADYLRRAAAATGGIARRMEVVIKKILELSTAESGANPVCLESADVALVLREAVDGVRPRAGERSIAVSVNVPPRLDTTTDAVILRVILTNLTQNAIEYAPSGSTVVVELHDADGIAFVIRNEAPDLAPADLAMLSEPYWRKDPARLQDGSAHAGIGLALAEELARRLGGTLDLSLSDGVLSAALRLRNG